MSDQSLATPAEAAAYLRTTKAKLANDRHAGVGIPFLRFNRKILYRWSDIYSFVEANILQRTDDQPRAAVPQRD